jgi:RNA polymerase sigma-70 factor (ECF subfamily)
MKIRRASRRPEGRLDAWLPTYDDTGHRVESAPSIEADAQSDLEREELRRHVRGCVAKLPLRYRAVVVLRDLEEKTTKETAELLKISEGAVKVRLHRARKALATLLGGK